MTYDVMAVTKNKEEPAIPTDLKWHMTYDVMAVTKNSLLLE